MANAIIWTLKAVCFFSLAALLLAALKYTPWPVTWTEFAGSKPFVEAMALLITPLGTVAAVFGVLINYHANRHSRDLTRRAQLTSSFQKGAEMLSSSRSSTQSAGAALLAEVALQAHEDFETPVTQALIAFISENEEKPYKSTFAALADPTSDVQIESTRMSTLDAWNMIGKLTRDYKNWWQCRKTW